MAEAERVDIAGMPKGVVLAALYNCSKPLAGTGFIDGLVLGCPIGPRQGEDLFRERGPTFASLGGRRLDVDISGHDFDPAGYDRHQGAGAAEAAIHPLRKAGPKAWTMVEEFEDGLTGHVVRDEVPGAIPNSSNVVKVNSVPGDVEELELTGASDGDLGIVLGSAPLAWGEGGRPIPAVTIYYVEWDHDPKVSYAVEASRIAPFRRSRTGS